MSVKTAQRRFLVDMHIPDWDERFLSRFDPEDYANLMKNSGAENIEIYAGSCLGLCYWPTDIGFRHANLNGRDLFGEMLSACKKRGLDVTAYLNVWNRAAYDAHPEWRMILPGTGGKGTVQARGQRFGVCCPNTPFGDFFISLTEELNCRYDFSGIWIDMIGWFSDICVCESCRSVLSGEKMR